MTLAETVVFIVKLVVGGAAAFCAVLLWARTKDSAWMSVVAGTVVKYAGTVYSMMIELGILFPKEIIVFGIPVSTLVFTAVPDLFFIAAFIIDRKSVV